MIGYDEATLKQVTVLNLTPDGQEGGIWQAGAGPAVDAAGNLYVLIGNGSVDSTLNAGGFPAKGDYGNGFVKLSTTGGVVAVADYFIMSNAASESNADQDLGSGGPMAIPAVNDVQGNARSLAVGAGKDGNIYVVDRSNMGKFSPSGNNIYQEIPSALGQVFSSPAWFNGSLYYGSVDSPLQAFPFTNGKFQAFSSQSSTAFEFPGTTPSISRNGTSNGIVWAAENSGNAVLHAYNANSLATELYNSNQAANSRDHFGAGNKFIVPTVVNGKVYVGRFTSGVGVFGFVDARRIERDGNFGRTAQPDSRLARSLREKSSAFTAVGSHLLPPRNFPSIPRLAWWIQRSRVLAFCSEASRRPSSIPRRRRSMRSCALRDRRPVSGDDAEHDIKEHIFRDAASGRNCGAGHIHYGYDGRGTRKWRLMRMDP